jgi:hypothetical protein
VTGPALSALYAAVFGRPWPVWAAGVLIATVNVFLFAFDRPWTASDGLRNWGDWVLTGLGLAPREGLLAHWIYRVNLQNLGVLLARLTAAVMRRASAGSSPP